MPKGGYKYTKQQPPKDTRNQLPKSHASSKLNRLIPKGQGKNCHLRSASTIQRLRMYKNGKEIRNKEGKIVGGLYLMNDRSGDSKITGGMCYICTFPPEYIVIIMLILLFLFSHRTNTAGSSMVWKLTCCGSI